MPKYVVTFYESSSRSYHVEAENKAEARKLALARYEKYDEGDESSNPEMVDSAVELSNEDEDSEDDEDNEE